jgi:hypothetical protein
MERARKAAEAVALYDQRFQRVEQQLTAVDGRLNLLQWMVGTTLVLTVAGMSVVVGLLLNIARLVELVSK